MWIWSAGVTFDASAGIKIDFDDPPEPDETPAATAEAQSTPGPQTVREEKLMTQTAQTASATGGFTNALIYTCPLGFEARIFRINLWDARIATPVNSTVTAVMYHLEEIAGGRVVAFAPNPPNPGGVAPGTVPFMQLYGKESAPFLRGGQSLRFSMGSGYTASGNPLVTLLQIGLRQAAQRA